MAAKLRLSLVLCVLAIWAVDFAFAHDASSHNAPAPSVDCTSLILNNLADCLSFVSDGSTTTKPEGNCCAGLKTVVKTDADCICEGFKSSASIGVSLNITKAMTLPAACNVSLPDSAFSNCALSPAAAAAPGPVAAAPGTGTGGNGAASAPAPSSGGSGSSVLTISVGSLLVGLVVASFSSF